MSTKSDDTNAYLKNTALYNKELIKLVSSATLMLFRIMFLKFKIIIIKIRS